MKILGIGAHPDDIQIGAGGTLAKHKASGYRVFEVSLSSGRNNPNDQKFETLPLVVIITWVEDFVEKLKPDIIYTTSSSDVNRDHRIINEAVLVATRPPCSVKEIYACDLTGFWAFGQFGTFNPNVFVDITDTIDDKMEGLKKYRDEMRPPPHYRSYENIRAVAQVTGRIINVPYAEAFQLIRRIIK